MDYEQFQCHVCVIVYVILSIICIGIDGYINSLHLVVKIILQFTTPMNKARP